MRLWLRDPLALAERIALIPEPFAPLLALMDGTRDVERIASEFQRRSGAVVPPAAVAAVVQSLDDALLLEGPRAAAGLAAARAAYRDQPFRPLAQAGRSYPADPAALAALCAGYLSANGHSAVQPLAPIQRAAGVLSPHIDYRRGGRLYGAVWQAAVEAVASAEVVVLFGTDHHGSAGALTPTRQRYATPWGTLPADLAAVDALAEALGGEAAYQEELHHRAEHSIELAAVWLHWASRQGGRSEPPPVIPVLCGSFHCYTSLPEPAGTAQQNVVQDPAGEPRGAAALAALAASIGRRRALVVSAADLAHVGPAFGDTRPLTAAQKDALCQADAALLDTALAGSAAGFLAHLRRERDQRRVCGLPPTYWTLRLLERLTGTAPGGRLAGYDQCPADEQGGSVVSIAGVLWE